MYKLTIQLWDYPAKFWYIHVTEDISRISRIYMLHCMIKAATKDKAVLAEQEKQYLTVWKELSYFWF